mgnify:CR=1 FL=1
MLASGEWAPWFSARALNGNPRFRFDTVAGRPILMLFAGSSRWPYSQKAIALAALNRHRFDDRRASFFGVSIDPDDVADGQIASYRPGSHWFLDDDHAVSHLFGAVRRVVGEDTYVPHWLVLDPMLRVVRSLPIDCGEEALALLEATVAQAQPLPAPVLIVPDVLDKQMCATLVAHHNQRGGSDSGFMRDIDGRTELGIDHSLKCRSDISLEDAGLINAMRDAIGRSIVPAIQRAYHYRVEHIERFLVACYDGDATDGDGKALCGHFRPHRDNTTLATAHRAFACSIHLNSGDYEGGGLRLPEFGPQLYSAPAGSALIFSCSLLHEVTPVTRGKRYVFLPFLYNAEGERIRQANIAHLAPTPAIRPAA